MIEQGRLFSREIAARFVTEGDFEAARQFFIDEKPALTAEVVLRFRGYTRVLLKQNPDNYGLYFVNPAAPVPFLWFGMAWRPNDPAGTLPAWGVSLEVNGEHVADFRDNVGGLLESWKAVTAQDEGIRFHDFGRHVELAEWRDFQWLLGQPDQVLALKRFWAGYLRTLGAASVPAAGVAFARGCGIA